ncbi:MAG TPA: 2-phospho-L-lactate guanylyltransferase [Streptosporangiaceae bacterium]|nr:2-phospho-L-lactate guanylyltransferase [Streptosporangiaceae bacterium]
MAAESAPASLRWSLVVPVKVLGSAKSRLAALAGPHRPALALAMATDTVTAALACPEVARVIVVTDDEQAAEVLTGLGALVTSDEPRRGLNPALRHGAIVATARWPEAGVAALAADLPALRPAELACALRAAAQWPYAFVPDAAGSGTTLYAARPGGAFSPSFGHSSAARHRTAGAAELTLACLASVRRDVDAPADLQAAAGLGVGPATAAVVARLS